MTIAAINTLLTSDLSVADAQWGTIHVHNRRRSDIDNFPADRIVVLQHGATYGSTAFELRLNGMSWMDYLAQRGFDVYCLDLPGYGRSQRPPQMDEPASNNPPFMRTAQAAACLASVVDFICERRAVNSVCLIGWSWGTAITSYFTVHQPTKVQRLVLYAPVWDRAGSGPSPIDVGGPLGAYRTVTREATLVRRQAGLPDNLKELIMPPAWFEQWWQATAATDPLGQGKTIRAPNGVVQDGKEYWSVGRPLYEPAKLTVPLLAVVGEWDKDTPPYMAQTLFGLATNASWKRLAVLSGGTHTLLMERNRLLLFRTVQQFLEEAEPGVNALR